LTNDKSDVSIYIPNCGIQCGVALSMKATTASYGSSIHKGRRSPSIDLAMSHGQILASCSRHICNPKLLDGSKCYRRNEAEDLRIEVLSLKPCIIPTLLTCIPLSINKISTHLPFSLHQLSNPNSSKSYHFSQRPSETYKSHVIKLILILTAPVALAQATGVREIAEIPLLLPH
jgi:hypothetical protein